MRCAALALLFATLGSAACASVPNYRVIDQIAGPDGGWDYVTVQDGRALIARRAAVTAVDLSSRVVTGAFAPANRGHTAMAINDGREVLITNGASDTADFVDAKTGTPLSSVATGKGPDAALLDPRSGLLLVMDHAGGDVTLIDPKAHQALARIPVGGKLEAAAVDGKGRAFVNIEDQDKVAVINLSGRTVAARYALPGCEGPTGVVYAQERLVIACDGAVAVVDPETGKVLEIQKSGLGADGIAYDPTNKRIFVPSGAAGSLAVFRLMGAHLRLEQIVPTAIGARTLAFDPQSGRVLLPCADMVTTDGKSSPRPGSFRLLIVGR